MDEISKGGYGLIATAQFLTQPKLPHKFFHDQVSMARLEGLGMK